MNFQHLDDYLSGNSGFSNSVLQCINVFDWSMRQKVLSSLLFAIPAFRKFQEDGESKAVKNPIHHHDRDEAFLVPTQEHIKKRTQKKPLSTLKPKRVSTSRSVSAKAVHVPV